MTLQEIAKKYELSVEYLKNQLIIGTDIELESGVDDESAEQIARSNISKMPDYYERFSEGTCR